MNPSRILVVEDEAVVALSIETALTSQGYEVAAAVSGPEALTLAESFRPHLALLDVRLGGEIDGIEVARRLRDASGVPALYLTACSDDDTVRRARETRPLGFIVKPFEQKALHAAIQMALELAESNPRALRPEWMQALLDSLPDAVAACGTDYRIVSANARFLDLAECSLDDAGERGLADLLGVEAAEWQREVAERGVRERFTFRIRTRAAKSHRLLEGSCEPLDGGGSDTGLLFRVRKAPLAIPVPAAGIGLPGAAEFRELLFRLTVQGQAATLGVFVLDRYHLLRRRFGEAIVRDLLTLYSVHISRSLGERDLLFQWCDTALVAVFPPPHEFDRTRKLIANIASARLEHFVRQESRQAMVFVSAAWEAIPAGGDPGAVESALRAFVEERAAADFD